MTDKIEPMTPEKTGLDPSLKTAILTAAFILGGFWLYNFLYPDLRGLDDIEKCEYRAYWKENGWEDAESCKAEVSRNRLSGSLRIPY